MTDDRPEIHVYTDHNPDDIRSLYEIPDALARRIQPTGDPRTFAQCLADILGTHSGAMNPGERP